MRRGPGQRVSSFERPFSSGLPHEGARVALGHRCVMLHRPGGQKRECDEDQDNESLHLNVLFLPDYRTKGHGSHWGIGASCFTGRAARKENATRTRTTSLFI